MSRWTPSKTDLPNFREIYEKRWFAFCRTVKNAEISAAGRVVPFGIDLLFAARDVADFIFQVEICEDLWAPAPLGALAGRSRAGQSFGQQHRRRKGR